MSYKKIFGLDSVKVIRSDGEDGEYSFRVYYNNILYDIINTPDDVNDGSIWRGPAVSYQIGPFQDNQKFKLRLESIEYDGGLRFGDGYAVVEKEFDINSKGLFNVVMKDSDSNEVEFRIVIDNSIDPPPVGVNTENGLVGVILYEDWHYNKEVDNSLNFLVRPRSQRLTVGSYNLPFEQELRVGGRWGSSGRALGVRPDTISSIKVGTGFSIELCDKPSSELSSGNRITIFENTPEIPSNWNDKAKSVRVFKL